MKFPWSEDIWFSPGYALSYFSQIKQKLGQEAVKNNKYRKEREAWIMGNILLGINKLTGREWWLQIPLDDPPDMLCMWVDIKQPSNVLNWREVEIMEITKYNQGSVAEEIKRKLKRKQYPHEYALVIYLRRDEKINDIRQLSEEVSKLSLGLADVWILGQTSPDQDKYVLFSLFPNVERIDYDMVEEITKLRRGNYLKMIKATGKNELERVTSEKEYEFVPPGKTS